MFHLYIYYCPSEILKVYVYACVYRYYVYLGNITVIHVNILVVLKIQM